MFAFCIHASFFLQYNDLYFSWCLLAIFAFIVLGFLREIENRKVFNPKYFAVFFLLISLLLMTGAHFHKVDERGMFIFGPNILYRIFCCASVILLYGFSNHKRVKTIIAFAFIFFLLGIYVTASRGGVVLLPILFIASLHFYKGKVHLIKMVLILAPLISLLIMYFTLYPLDIDSRLLSLSYEDNMRYQPWRGIFKDTSAILGDLRPSYSYFNKNFAAPGFTYPHNIILEFIYFFGFFGFCFITLLIAIFISRSMKLLRQRFSFDVLVFYVGLIILMGSMFSGDLSDNAVAISLMFFIIGRTKVV